MPLLSTSLPSALFSSSLALPLAALAAVALDRLLGEARRWHPLVGFGKLVGWLEKRLNNGSRPAGVLAWLLAVAPFFALALWLRSAAPFLVDTTLLYFAIGARSLAEHGQRVANDLAADDLPAAREHVGWMVSRDTSVLDADGVAKATIESLLENGNDAIFGTLFWFAVAGGPGALLFRLANTLDAMWGYRTPRFLHFGWAAARLDDLLNYLPARLTAASYALLGQTGRALACWRAQAPTWDSPNAGPVMASGAGALGLALGGGAIYHGQWEERPPLGSGQAAQPADIGRALSLIRRSLWLWLALLPLVSLLAGLLREALHA